MDSKKQQSLPFVAFLQAAGLTAYCGLVAVLFWQGNRWFGKMPGYFGPLLFLMLFSTSAFICGIITLYYPFILVWQKKQTNQAVCLVFYTAGWLVLITFVILILLLFYR